MPLGLGGLKMTIDFEKLEERPLEFASMRAKGKGVGAMMDMTTSFTLSGEGDHTLDGVGGRRQDRRAVGSMGQRVLQPIVNQQVGRGRQVIAARSRQQDVRATESGVTTRSDVAFRSASA